MAKNQVTSGDYTKKNVSVDVRNRPYIDNGGFVGTQKIFIDRSNVVAYELLDSEQQKSVVSGAIRGTVGSAILGPVGMIAGVISAKDKGTHLVAVEFNDGKRSLLEVDRNIYTAIITACFGVQQKVYQEQPQNFQAPGAMCPVAPVTDEAKAKKRNWRKISIIFALSCFAVLILLIIAVTANDNQVPSSDASLVSTQSVISNGNQGTSDEGALTYTNQNIAVIVDNRSSWLTEDEASGLYDKSIETGKSKNINIMFVLASNLGGKTDKEYADDYYDAFATGSTVDGYLFLIITTKRSVYISTCGKAVDVLSNKAISDLVGEVTPYLSSGEYYDGLSLVLEKSADYF